MVLTRAKLKFPWIPKTDEALNAKKDHVRHLALTAGDVPDRNLSYNLREIFIREEAYMGA